MTLQTWQSPMCPKQTNI